ncbi:hypothetical protein ACF3NG_09765 [Aerococcaceae bacterium WGS1372]
MNKRRKQPLLLLITILLCQTSAMQNIVLAENISPIESIEWGDGVSSEPESETTSETTNEVEVNEASESDEKTDASSKESTSENAQSEPDAKPSLDTSNPLAFLESLAQFERRTIEFVNFLSEDENVEMVSQNTLVDGNKYYTAQLIPPFLPKTLFLKTDGEVTQAAHLSLDDLMKYAADALNTQPQIYEGTVVEEFYNFSQENYEKFDGKVVEIDSTSNALAESTVKITRIEAYLTEVALEWLSQENVINAFETNELGEQILINGDLATSFNEIAQAKQANYPELGDFFESFVNIEGTMNADYTNGVFGFGLIVPGEGEDVKGLEMYIAQSQGEIIDFSEDIIFSYEDFSELAGKDIIQEMQEFEESITADQFEQTTE